MPAVKQLSKLARKMLEVIQGADGWMTRRELGQRLGRPGAGRVNPHDIKVLNELVALELLEVKAHTIGTVKDELLYRIAQSDKAD